MALLQEIFALYVVWVNHSSSSTSIEQVGIMYNKYLNCHSISTHFNMKGHHRSGNFVINGNVKTMNDENIASIETEKSVVSRALHNENIKFDTVWLIRP